MSERIKVPDFMIEAGENSGAGCGRRSVEMILEAALQWLSKNPIHPSPEQWRRLFSDWGDRINASSTMGKSPHPIEDQLRFTVIEWQKRMFRVEEPEVPEEIRRLWEASPTPDTKRRVIEAYEIGKAKTTAVPDPDDLIRDLLANEAHTEFHPDNINYAVREAFRRGKESR